MGGMGFIENNKALCMLSVLINTHLLLASRSAGVERYFYASSACVYNAEKQKSAQVTPLKEEDAYPALPEDGYGWEKLFSERMCRHFEEDFKLQCRVARFHNVYGPLGTYTGGREKAPAAICRKVVDAQRAAPHEIEIWGDGNQTRSFMYIDDCIKGINMITCSDIHEPINLGSSELVTINQLVDIVENIAGVRLKRNYKLDAPKGVNGRNSDNTKIRECLGWEPSIRLRDGMAKTYTWIEDADARSDATARDGLGTAAPKTGSPSLLAELLNRRLHFQHLSAPPLKASLMGRSCGDLLRRDCARNRVILWLSGPASFNESCFHSPGVAAIRESCHSGSELPARLFWQVSEDSDGDLRLRSPKARITSEIGRFGCIFASSAHHTSGSDSQGRVLIRDVKYSIDPRCQVHRMLDADSEPHV